MTQLAPDPDPTVLDPTVPDPTATAPGDAARLVEWWSSLARGRRRPLLQLPPGEALPRSVATELWRRGVHCPLVLVGEHGRLVRRALPPPALQELLARERAAGDDLA